MSRGIHSLVPSFPILNTRQVRARRGHSKVLARPREQRHHGAICGTDTRGRHLAADFGGEGRLGFQIRAFVRKPIVHNVRKNRQAVEAAVVG